MGKKAHKCKQNFTIRSFCAHMYDDTKYFPLDIIPHRGILYKCLSGQTTTKKRSRTCVNVQSATAVATANVAKIANAAATANAVAKAAVANNVTHPGPRARGYHKKRQDTIDETMQ